MRRATISIISLIAFTGCDSVQRSSPPNEVHTNSAGHFSLLSSSDGTFLLDNEKGTVWRYTSDGVFRAISTVSEDTLLMRLPDGDKKEIPLSQVRDLVRKGATVEKDQGPTVDEIVKALNDTFPPASSKEEPEKKSSGQSATKK